MPKSKHRRKDKARPRAYEMAPPPKNPDPSPTWVPVTGVVLLGIGVVIILAGYFTEFAAGWPGLGANWPLVMGFALLAAGFAFLTQWR